MSLPQVAGKVLFLLATTACVAQSRPAKGCLSYEPAVVNLNGILISETFPGPPNYEGTRQGDKAEVYWLIDLSRPVCVNADKREPDLNQVQKSVRRVQLVLDPIVYERQKGLLGKRVVVTGTLFGAHTAHHHTPVLLTVKTLEVAER